ncbi:hypothetical protein PsorP6_005865 [Peronosclerospora sorghi]|uniref:Uncharacterized protein n=1 Tax=Peronosclerospora sorghi TaxID=230839 RepID=A0ACC0W649_9STRA|nr:hypothetical protein PsorP6_005865 [Peronosclerospora sorghi]
MVPAPHYVKSVALKNTTSYPVKVIATFGSDELEAMGKAKIQETSELAPGAEASLKEHEYDMDGWKAVAPFISLEVEHLTDKGPLGKTLYTPSVDRIVNVLHIDIGADDDAKNFKVTSLCDA